MKRLLIVAVVLVALFAVLGAAGIAYAQTRTPNWENGDPGTRGWRGGRGPGMMGSDGFGRGPMHPYMVDALAKALGLTPEAVQERIEAGETPWEIAVSTGLDEEQARKVLADAHNAALDAAVAAAHREVAVARLVVRMDEVVRDVQACTWKELLEAYRSRELAIPWIDALMADQPDADMSGLTKRKP